MNRKLTPLLLISTLSLTASCQLNRTPADRPVAHPFLCADYGANMIRIASAEGEIVWEYPANRPQDAWQLPNGNVLFTHLRGAKEITRDKKVVWEYETQKPNEVHTCQPLSNGVVMIALSGPCEILEIDRSGKILKTVKLTTGREKPHAQMRQARKLRNGNYLVGHNADRVLREYDPTGKVIRTIAVEGNPYGGIRLPNGNTLIACGDGHKIVEIDPDGKIVWQVDENDLEGNPLRFVAGMQRLPNGNTVVCNWGGHGHVGEQPQIFEVTPQKQVVWQVYDFKKFSTISGIQILDVEGDPTRGKILR
jgi:hypothetical protein